MSFPNTDFLVTNSLRHIFLLEEREKHADMPRTFANSFANLAQTVTQIDQVLVSFGLFNGIQILAQHILSDGEFHHLLIGEVTNSQQQLRQPRPLSSS